MEISPTNNVTPPPVPVKNNSLKNRYSIPRLMHALEEAFARFPISILYFVLGIIVVNIIIWNGNVDGAYVYSTVLGATATLALYLWCECYEPSGDNARYLAILSQVILNVIILCDFLYLLNLGRSCNEAETMGHAAALSASFIAVFFVPSERGQLKEWIYTFRQMISGFIATLIGNIAWIAFMLMIIAVSALYSLKIFGGSPVISTLFSSAVTVTMSLTYFIFVSRIPKQYNIDIFEKKLRIVEVLGKYLLLPLLGLYMAVMYGYALKILFTLELPEGYVTIPVVILVAEVLIVEFFLWPLTPDKLKPISFPVKIVIPALTIPLLVLMSVGIGYRINEYGFTPDRLYALAFNIWCYVVMVGLVIDRCRHINWIPVSFAIAMVAVSCIPGFNLTVLGENLMRENPVETIHNEEYNEVGTASEKMDSLHNELNEIPEPGKGGNRLSVFSYQPAEDGPTELPEGVTGFRDFECTINGVIPDNLGRVSVGVSGARGRLNIDSLLKTSDLVPMHPVVVKVPGVADKCLLVTGVKGFAKEYDDSINGQCYAVKARVIGYVLDKRSNSR